MTPVTTKNGEHIVVKEGTPSRQPLFEPFRTEPLFAEFFARPWGFGTFMDRMLQRPLLPAMEFDVDLYEKDGEYVIECALPGFRKQEIDIEVNGRQLTIVAKSKETIEEKKPRYFYRERYKGDYRRMISFQEPIKPELILATYTDGILKIQVPVPEVEKTKRVQIAG